MKLVLDSRTGFLIRKGDEFIKAALQKLESFNYITANVKFPYTAEELNIEESILPLYLKQIDEADKSALRKLEPCVCESSCLAETCKRSLANIECNDACVHGELCGNKRLEKLEASPRPQLEVFIAKETPEVLLALRTTQPVLKNSYVMEFKGELIGHKLCGIRRQCGKCEFIVPLKTSYTGGSFIDCEAYGNESRVIRMSCVPNCSLNKVLAKDQKLRMVVVSTKNIEAGEELTLPKSSFCGWNWKLTYCTCGLPGCESKVIDEALLLKPANVRAGFAVAQALSIMGILNEFDEEWPCSVEAFKECMTFFCYHLEHFKQNANLEAFANLPVNRNPINEVIRSGLIQNPRYGVLNPLIRIMKALPLIASIYKKEQDGSEFAAGLQKKYLKGNGFNMTLAKILNNLDYNGNHDSAAFVELLDAYFEMNEEYEGLLNGSELLSCEKAYPLICSLLADEFKSDKLRTNIIKTMLQELHVNSLQCMACLHTFGRHIGCQFGKPVRVPRANAALSLSECKKIINNNETRSCPKCCSQQIKSYHQLDVSPNYFALIMLRGRGKMEVSFPHYISIRSKKCRYFYRLLGLIEPHPGSDDMYKALTLTRAQDKILCTTRLDSEATESAIDEQPLASDAPLVFYELIPTAAEYKNKVVDITKCLYDDPPSAEPAKPKAQVHPKPSEPRDLRPRASTKTGTNTEFQAKQPSKQTARKSFKKT